jgi:hypothetical protein
MKFLLCLLMGVLFSLSAFAQTRNSDFSYRGQAVERVSLNYDKVETRYRDEQRQSTCYRDETYSDRVCEDRTYYRNECRTVYDNVCRNVTRYRERCTTSPSRQVCSTSPSRQVCSTSPSRQVCRTDSRGRRSCRTVPGRRTCRTVAGRRTCRTVQGRRTCRQVPYQDRVCSQVPRQVCSQVPYTRRECRDVTRTRRVPYSCTTTVRVPYQAIVARYLAEVNINFVGYTQDQASFSVNIDDQGRVQLQLTSADQDVITLVNQQQFSNPVNGVNEISAGFDLRFDTRQAYFSALELGEVKNARIKVQNQQILFEVQNQVEASSLVVSVKLANDRGETLSGKFNLSDQDLFEFATTANGATIVTFTPGSNLRERLEVGNYKLDLNFEIKKLGTTLNNDLPYRNVEKTFNNVQVIQ